MLILPVYNNKERGHDALFREVATRNFSELLDELAIPNWRQKQAEIEAEQLPEIDDLEGWFG